MKIAVIAHVFYPELWPELARCIRNFRKADIFVTYPETLPESTEQIFRRDFPHADVKRLENRGYDIGPFIETIERLNLNDYDLIVKLHTKRNRRAIVKYLPYFGSMWRRKLLAFCSTTSAASRTLEIFRSHTEVGMIGHGDLIMHASDELVPEALNTPASEDFPFVAGTMFAVRAKLLKSIPSEIHFTDFPLMHGRDNSNLAWEWERKLGKIVVNHGFTLFGYPSNSTFSKTFQTINKSLYRVYSHSPIFNRRIKHQHIEHNGF